MSSDDCRTQICEVKKIRNKSPTQTTMLFPKRCVSSLWKARLKNPKPTIDQSARIRYEFVDIALPEDSMK